MVDGIAVVVIEVVSVSHGAVADELPNRNCRGLGIGIRAVELVFGGEGRELIHLGK